jgi:uncharacterized membrane protein HdeD (DUF308 family)
MSRRVTPAVLITLGLAAAIHTDWHFARPAHHRLSLGLPWHWVLAIPVFAAVAWCVARMWPASRLRVSVAIVGSAVVIAGVVEPAFEYFVGGAPFEWAFGAERNVALATYVGTGLLAYAATLIAVRRRS